MVVIRPAQCATVTREYTEEISPAVYGCDECLVEIPQQLCELKVTAYHKDDRNHLEDHTFCSWRCLFKYLPKVKFNSFISFPYIHYSCPADNPASMDSLLNLLRDSGLIN